MAELPRELRLVGDVFVLRDWREADAPALEPVCGDPNVSSFTSIPWDYTEAAARAWVVRQSEKRAAETVLALAIVEPGRELPVGNVNLGAFDSGEGSASIGYWIVPDARGRGLAVRASRLLIDWGFDVLGLKRVEFAILPENLASRRVAEHLGATYEGLRRDSHLEHGRAWDMRIYSVSR